MTIMPVIFRDKDGEERIEFQSTGQSLATVIRGVELTGTGFDSLSPEPLGTRQFDLHSNCLCNCSFHVEIPIRLATPEGLRLTHLKAEIILGAPSQSGGLDFESYRVGIAEPEIEFMSDGSSGWFENDLLSLVEHLPAGFRLEACITCGLSDYSPYGHGSLGDMACFRDAAADYREVRSKAGIFNLWGRMTEYVQETHFCPAYEPRPKGRGYRG